MKLIIAEKPMLARAIADAIPGTEQKKNGYSIKGGYTIVSAFGHLLTLKEPEDYDAEKYGRWTLEALPIFFPDWGQKPGEGKTERLNLIGSLLKEADCVIHAGDPDDEGQYLIDEILRWFHYSGPVLRLATGDTTEAALQKALASMKDNADFVNAGLSAHARSVADIMVGFNFSRYFSLKNPHVKLLTIGRVQTPTLGLVVTRDMAIENHSARSYYTIRAELELEGHRVPARFEPSKDNPHLDEGRITDPDYAQSLVKSLKDRSFAPVAVTRKELTEQPPLPFNLVKLQTYCSSKFGYDPSQTLAITQRLRDNHNAITYNRSDCQYLSEEQYKQSPGTIRQVLANLQNDPAGKAFERLPLDPALHSRAFDDSNITAHTAIIPQNRRLDLTKLSEEERNVYLAITKYYMAQFLPPAKKERSALEIPLEGGSLRASSTHVTFPGYLQLIRPEKKKDAEDGEEENDLSLILPGSYTALCTDASAEGKETKAPPRYTKASLNEDMTRIARYVTDPEAKALLLAKDKEKKGENGSIGTSATRASIIDSLEERGFIECRGKQIRSTMLGRELYRILPDQLRKPDMTGYWWAIQESIQDGSRPWTDLTDSVLDMIRTVLAEEHPKVDAYHVPESMRRGKIALGFCPRCGREIIEGKLGFGCSGWKDGCRFTIWKSSDKGMLKKTELQPDMVHTLLASGWVPELRPDESGTPVPTGRLRTEATLDLKRLYSEKTKSTYAARVYLADEGAESGRSPSFAVQELLSGERKSLGPCPRCGRDVLEGKQAFGCSGWREGCRFTIWFKAKSGMMSKTRITAAMVKTLLASPWIADDRPVQERPKKEQQTSLFFEAPDPNAPPPADAPAPNRRRTEATVHVTTLYSDAKKSTYTGDVFLADDGVSPYGAGFGLAALTHDAPEVLGKCPRCGKDVLETEKSFGCSGWRDGCKFTIWKSSHQKLLSNVTFTKTDAKKFLAGKPVKKKHLLDAREQDFTAQLLMIEEADNPYGPVFRVLEGSIEAPEGKTAEDIRIDTVPLPEGKKPEGSPLPAEAPEEHNE